MTVEGTLQILTLSKEELSTAWEAQLQVLAGLLIEARGDVKNCQQALASLTAVVHGDFHYLFVRCACAATECHRSPISALPQCLYPLTLRSTCIAAMFIFNNFEEYLHCRNVYIH